LLWFFKELQIHAFGTNNSKYPLPQHHLPQMSDIGESFTQHPIGLVQDATDFQNEDLYRPLSKDRKETRFVMIKPATNQEEEIECSMYTAELDECPEYRALSYVWGSPNTTQIIRINSLPYRVTMNLFIALKHLRSLGYTHASLWIDALSVDQRNLVEQGHQVTIMGQIYSNAAQVLIWLGPAMEAGRIAVETLRNLATLSLRESQDGKELEGLWREGPPAEILGKERLSALEDIFSRPWWTRQWVIQESVLAKDILILYGREQLGWYDFLAACRNILRLRQHIPYQLSLIWGNFDLLFDTAGFQTTMRIANQRSARLNPVKLRALTLWDLLVMYRSPCESSRSLDKIYALLGMCSDAKRIVPDYERTFAAVATDVMVQRIQARMNPNDLSHCLFRDSPSHMSLPSWVPDWTDRVDSPPIYNHLFTASSSDGSSLDINFSNLTLGLEALLFDQIAISIPYSAIFPDLVPPRASQSWIKDLFSQFSTLVRPNNASLGRCIAYTLCLGYDPFTQTSMPLDSEKCYARALVFSLYLESKFHTSRAFTKDAWLASPSGERNDNGNRGFAFIGDGNNKQEGDDWDMYKKVDSMTEYNRPFEFYLDSCLNPKQRKRGNLFITCTGHLGWGPTTLMVGDVIALVSGSKVPFVLRKLEGRQQYRLLGEGFILGVTEEKAFRDGKGFGMVELC
jgi:hypothetical protein